MKKRMIKGFVIGALYIEDFVYRCLDYVGEKILQRLGKDDCDYESRGAWESKKW